MLYITPKRSTFVTYKQKNNIMKSQVFKTAWSLFKTNIFTTFAEALKSAWAEVKLKIALIKGVVKITFRKSNGEITERLATLSKDLFTYESKGADKPIKAGVIKFWSITDDAFRSCRIERLISFTNK